MTAPPKQYVFSVQGRGAFPTDMLRYDSCWPRTETNSSIIDSLANPRHRALARVELRGLAEPTVGRWESFGWKVIEVKPA